MPWPLFCGRRVVYAVCSITMHQQFSNFLWTRSILHSFKQLLLGDQFKFTTQFQLQHWPNTLKSADPIVTRSIAYRLITSHASKIYSDMKRIHRPITSLTKILENSFLSIRKIIAPAHYSTINFTQLLCTWQWQAYTAVVLTSQRNLRQLSKMQ